MRMETGTTVIRGGRLFDGTGAAAVADAALVIDDGVVTYAGPEAAMPAQPQGARRIDVGGGTIMPGLVEAHFHPTYFDVAALEDLDIKYPVEIFEGHKRYFEDVGPGEVDAGRTRR